MADWYLNADTGNDTTGDGSSGNPWLTVAKAYTSASDGDTIYLQGSTANYTFPNQLFAKSLNIRGVEGDATEVVLDGSAFVRRWYTNGNEDVVLDIRWVTFYNITTEGAGTYRNTIAGYNLTVSNCIFRKIINSSASGNAGVAGIVGTEYAGTASPLAITIQNNLFYELEGGTPNLYISLHNNGGADTGYVRWYNNTVYADGSYTTPVMFVCNTVASVDFEVKNNIFYATSSTAMPVSGSALDDKFNYNLTYNCTNVPDGTGNITSDPLFVDAANDNFNLRPSSPCIDTGTII